MTESDSESSKLVAMRKKRSRNSDDKPSEKRNGKRIRCEGLSFERKIKVTSKFGRFGNDCSSIFSYCTTRNFGIKCICKKKTLYSCISCVGKYGTNLSQNVYDDSGDGGGAIFNIEYSPDNKYLVAACEKKSVVIFDPCIHKKVMYISNAHRDCVNCVTFLDTRIFATCSDDNTIALWDVRNLRSKFISLTGHTSWVKSLNYNPRTNILISSAFDDTVRTWNVNDYSDCNSVKGKTVMHTPFLMRTELSCDYQKFIIATSTGLFVIHNVDFSTLDSLNLTDNTDDNSNNQNNYELSTTGVEKINRIQCIKTFPLNSEPRCIASLQIHPNGCNVLSRYISNGCEWSVVHNIEDYPAGNTMERTVSSLQGYVEEANLAGDYIKELCYNHDGTVICSPFGNGIRLLGFDSNCSQFSECLSDKPRELKEIRFIVSHKSSVLTTRFGKHIPILASGCLGGQISFYQLKL